MKSKYLPFLVIVILAFLPCAVRAQSQIQIASTPTGVVWQGWGCSICWWGKAWGNTSSASKMTRIVFSMNKTRWNNTELPGLGFTVARYNVGGSGGGAVYGALKENISPNMIPATTIHTYWLHPGSTNPSSKDWNWEADSAQRHVMKLAQQDGVKYFEFFSNSPPWWMCNNLSTAGGDNHSPNLNPKYYKDFALYMSAVVSHAMKYWHVPVYSVEPFNEPRGSWWTFPSGQEGCIFNVADQVKLIPLLHAAMAKDNLTGKVILTASDENSTPVALNSWQRYPEDVKSMVGKVNTHTYDYSLNNRANLHAAVGTTSLWVSEHGDGDPSGLTLAQTLVRDLNQLKPSAWCYWQPYDSGGWGMINADRKTGELGNTTQKYYVMAQFSRYIRPGSELLNSNNLDTVDAYNATSHTLTLVHLTGAKHSGDLTINLSAFKVSGTSATVVCTTSKPTDEIPNLRLKSVSGVSIGNSILTIPNAYPNAIYTIVVKGVTM